MQLSKSCDSVFTLANPNGTLTNKVKQEGEKILKKNDFFRKLMNLMNSAEFNDFYDSYFKDWSDIETIVFYIKLYKTIDYEYSRRFNEDIDDEIMTYMLYNVMNNNETRKLALEKFRDFKDHKNIDMSKTAELRYLFDFSNYSLKRTTSQLTYVCNDESVKKLNEILSDSK
jgi:hypothetical protein